jgi:predicted nucleotidyltransferase
MSSNTFGKEFCGAESERVIRDIKTKYAPERIYVFGSSARGDLHEGSDLDLAIIKETDKRFQDRILEVLELGDYGIPVEPLVYTPDEFERMRKRGNPLIQTILEEGKLVYERQ